MCYRIRVRGLLVLVTGLAALAPVGEVRAEAASPYIVAHRGASKDAPENTLPAFELAWKQGADAIEGDFYLTKDGEIACIHDKDTKRVSGEKLVVADSTLAELQRLDVGRWHSEKFAGTRVPTLADVLATVPGGKRIYVEVKCGPEIVPTLLRQLRDSKLENDQIVVISFNADVVRAIEKRASEIRTFWLVGFKVTGAGAVVPAREAVLETLRSTATDGLGSNVRIPEPTSKAVLGSDHEWHVWTIDIPDDARRFLARGAQSITTNVPGAMRRALEPR